ncbi:MAG: methionine--tRNA ligase [Candidatus Vogelbacteria bacterium]|nr:methionine--tRNA ligase [Candidatus Vogelbacteria bacterium]
MDKRIYITTTLPYVNAKPHMGHALEFVRADVYARYFRKVGYEVFANFGTDEHGKKIYEKAVEAKQTPQEYVDFYAGKFLEIKKLLNLSFDNFIRTTDANHVDAAIEFWKVCWNNGDIYKNKYKVKYCVGCELEKQDSDLVNGECPDHLGRKIEEIEEENYFFRFSKYEKQLLELYAKNPDFVVPESRFNEIKAFVSRGLSDFSVSRLKSKMPWGIDVPGDPEQVVYVWFDALVNYIAAIGWPVDMEKFEKWWPVVQFCGKDNLRQQSAMWQAMLMSAGLPPSEKIFINGFVISGGQKMSKTIGNTIDPVELVEGYGTDALRYYVTRGMSIHEDSDMTEETFKLAYNSGLAGGVGNLTNRILKMAEDCLSEPHVPKVGEYEDNFKKLVESYRLNEAMDLIWKKVTELDQRIQKDQPFKLVKTDKEKAAQVVRELIDGLAWIAEHLEIFLPDTSAKMAQAIKKGKKPEVPLFARKD